MASNRSINYLHHPQTHLIEPFKWLEQLAHPACRHQSPVGRHLTALSRPGEGQEPSAVAALLEQHVQRYGERRIEKPGLRECFQRLLNHVIGRVAFVRLAGWRVGIKEAEFAFPR
jgi:hypothetical protein